jgi:Fe-S cluster biogenesis protein NfuA
LFISVEVTPNPESLKFIPMGESFNITEPRDFTSYREALASPLAKDIFQIEGVRGVFIGKEFVSVLKDPSATWTLIKPQVYVAITNFMESGQPVILPESEVPAGRKDTTILPEDSEQVAMVKELLESTIRPGLQEDGGDVEYLGIKDGVVLLKLQGSCRTCPSSSAHIKGGVERSLTYWVPGITGVLAVTDDELEKLNLEEFRKIDQAATMAESASTSSSQSEKAL